MSHEAKNVFDNEDKGMNPTLLSPRMPKLWFFLSDRRYEIPTDADWIMKYYVPHVRNRRNKGHSMEYMRGTEEIEAGSKQRNCTGTLEC